MRLKLDYTTCTPTKQGNDMTLTAGNTYKVHGKNMIYRRSNYSVDFRQNKHFFVTMCGKWNCNILDKELVKFVQE
jgi:hypothetical protein